MFLRVIFETKPLQLGSEEKVAFVTSKSGTNIQILMECIKDDELKKGQLPGCVRCSAQTELMLTEEEEGELERPKGEGDRTSGKVLEKIETELREIVERVIYIYRWRRGAGDIHNPIVYRFIKKSGGE